MVSCKVAPKNSNRSSQRTSKEDGIQSADYETALDMAGYGSFSRSVLGACACAFFMTGIENSVMSYALPAAKCELSLTTYQAGLVNMAFMCGGVASAFFWGIIGDVFGRRNTLSLTLLLNAFITITQSTVSDYKFLLAARTLNGFLVGGPSTLVFTYLSDLVGEKRRQFYLSVTGMCFVAAWLIMPGISWLVIPVRLDYETQLPIYSWRLLILVSSVPSLVAGLWLLFLPESPRLLVETNRAEEAIKILASVYKKNGGLGEFKITKLTVQNESEKHIDIDQNQNRTKQLFLNVLKDLRTFVSKAYAVKSSLLMYMFFANMAAGFGLNLWIPELLLRMHLKDCSNNSDGSIINLSRDNLTWQEISFSGRDVVSEFCDDTISIDVYTSGLIVGAVCIAVNAVCSLMCSSVSGVRRASASCAAACALACVCLAASACGCAASNRWAVAAAAVLNAASLNGNVLLIRLLLFALPAKLSGLGVCWGAWWGRAGGLLSNFAVGLLLDLSCPAPFVAVAVLLALSIATIMVIKTDNVEEVTKIDEQRLEKNITLDRYISHM